MLGTSNSLRFDFRGLHESTHRNRRQMAKELCECQGYKDCGTCRCVPESTCQWCPGAYTPALPSATPNNSVIRPSSVFGCPATFKEMAFGEPSVLLAIFGVLLPSWERWRTVARASACLKAAVSTVLASPLRPRLQSGCSLRARATFGPPRSLDALWATWRGFSWTGTSDSR